MSEAIPNLRPTDPASQRARYELVILAASAGGLQAIRRVLAVRDVKALGGTVIAQDQATSQCWGMPRAAIATGAVDMILPLDDIGPTLTELTMNGRTHRRTPVPAV
jgi:chemotaxis response regulator CheB